MKKRQDTILNQKLEDLKLEMFADDLFIYETLIQKELLRR
jgi:hypothetical protein